MTIWEQTWMIEVAVQESERKEEEKLRLPDHWKKS